MGCSGSKEMGEEDRIAVKRNATIDRMIRNDKKYQDRTVKILLLGMACSLLVLWKESCAEKIS